MSKPIKTKNINKIFTYLIGGKSDLTGNRLERDFKFDLKKNQTYKDDFKTNGDWDVEKVKDIITVVITELSSPFIYYNVEYICSMPTDLNLNNLAHRVLKHLKGQEKSLNKEAK